MSAHVHTSTRRQRTLTRMALAVVGVATLALVTAPLAAADPIATGSAAGFGTEITLSTTQVVREPFVEVKAPPGDEDETVIDVAAPPVVVSGTLTALANVHVESDITSNLTVNAQTVEGPYNARGLGLIENAQVLLDAAGEDVPLLSAAVIRAEAVAVCRAGAVQYSANSEIIDLRIGGEIVPLDAPLSQLIDEISGLLGDTGLDAVVNVERNVVTQLEGGGVAVDALVVTVLDALGEVPLARIRLAHGEVGPLTCQPPPPPPAPEEPRAELPATGGTASLAGAAFLAAALGARALRRRATS